MITTTVTYIAWLGEWRVSVYHNGAWIEERRFATEERANAYAAEAKLRG